MTSETTSTTRTGPSATLPSASAPADTPARVAADRRRNHLWAELMQRSFGVDVQACPRCGDRLTLIALIEDPRVIRRILGHLGLPAIVPAARPARSPPLPLRHDRDEAAAAPPVTVGERSSGPVYDPDIDLP